jgi:hypothetical protein
MLRKLNYYSRYTRSKQFKDIDSLYPIPDLMTISALTIKISEKVQQLLKLP